MAFRGLFCYKQLILCDISVSLSHQSHCKSKQYQLSNSPHFQTGPTWASEIFRTGQWIRLWELEIVGSTISVPVSIIEVIGTEQVILCVISLPVKWGICVEEALRSLSSALSDSVFIAVNSWVPPGSRLWIWDLHGGGLLGSALGIIPCGGGGTDAGLARGRKGATVQFHWKLKLGWWSEGARPSDPHQGATMESLSPAKTTHVKGWWQRAPSN